MSDDQTSLISFLNFILRKSPIETSVRISKSELTEILRTYFSKMGMQDDPDLVFEDWEPQLRKSFFIQNQLIHYNIYTETLTIEVVPTLEIINRAAETHSTNMRSSLISLICALSFEEFETLMRELFQRVPWIEKINITQLSRDGGIDFEGIYRDRKSGLRMKLYGQAKHWSSKVGSEILRTFIGSISVKSTLPSIGIFVSTGGYTDDAITVMQKSPIKILVYDIDSLVNLMIEHEIGVKAYKVEGKTIDELFWKEISE